MQSLRFPISASPKNHRLLNGFPKVGDWAYCVQAHAAAQTIALIVVSTAGQSAPILAQQHRPIGAAKAEGVGHDRIQPGVCLERRRDF